MNEEGEKSRERKKEEVRQKKDENWERRQGRKKKEKKDLHRRDKEGGSERLGQQEETGKPPRAAPQTQRPAAELPVHQRSYITLTVCAGEA